MAITHRQWLTSKLNGPALVAVVYFAMVTTASHSLQMGGRSWVAGFLEPIDPNSSKETAFHG